MWSHSFTIASEVISYLSLKVLTLQRRIVEGAPGQCMSTRNRIFIRLMVSLNICTVVGITVGGIERLISTKVVSAVKGVWTLKAKTTLFDLTRQG